MTAPKYAFFPYFKRQHIFVLLQGCRVYVCNIHVLHTARPFLCYLDDIQVVILLYPTTTTIQPPTCSRKWPTNESQMCANDCTKDTHLPHAFLKCWGSTGNACQTRFLYSPWFSTFLRLVTNSLRCDCRLISHQPNCLIILSSSFRSSLKQTILFSPPHHLVPL